MGLSLLQDGVQLGRLHNIALDLELSAHEESLGVGIAGNELAEVVVGEGEGDYLTFHVLVNGTENSTGNSPKPGFGGSFGRGTKGGRGKLTSRLGTSAIADLASLLEVNVPALRLAGLVLQGKGKDSIALLNGGLAVSLAGERGADGIKSR